VKFRLIVFIHNVTDNVNEGTDVNIPAM
jgi:hypothetical protein